jgi:hypothetical protein
MNLIEEYPRLADPHLMRLICRRLAYSKITDDGCWLYDKLTKRGYSIGTRIYFMRITGKELTILFDLHHKCTNKACWSI